MAATAQEEAGATVEIEVITWFCHQKIVASSRPREITGVNTGSRTLPVKVACPRKPLEEAVTVWCSVIAHRSTNGPWRLIGVPAA